MKLPKGVEKKMQRIIALEARKDCLRRQVEAYLERVGVDVDQLLGDDAEGLADVLTYGCEFSLGVFKRWFENREDKQ